MTNTDTGERFWIYFQQAIHPEVGTLTGLVPPDVAVEIDSDRHLLAHFGVVVDDTTVVLQARQLPLAYFEDATVATLVQQSQCDHMVSRNVSDVFDSPVPAVTPGDFLSRHS